MNATIFHVAFWIAAVTGVYMAQTGVSGETYACFKGLPIALLIIYSASEVRAGDKSRLRFCVLIGLLLSMIADLVIMRSFLGGLVYFLIAHILYIVGTGIGSAPRSRIAAAVAPAFVYLLLMVAILFPRVETGMHIPVMVYSAIITSMLGLATVRAFVTEKSDAARLFWFGALLFVISDSTIAANRWRIKDMQYDSLIIMSTYYAGQYFICLGAAKK
jgi:uncharacterized membrane protein YhhN